MNIFYLDKNPQIAAQMQVDRHVVKMTLESAQLLCTAHQLLNAYKDPALYKIAHAHHPCSKWVCASLDNYEWLYWHFIALADEYTFRYGKKHLSDIKLREVLQYIPSNIPRIGPTKPAQAMPDCYKHEDPVIAYRNYYIGEKQGFAVWTKRPRPEWMISANVTDLLNEGGIMR